MTSDELNKFTKALDMVNQLLDREEKLQEIIKMQREALNYYSNEYDWRDHYFRLPIASIRHRDDLTLPKLFLGYQKAKTTQQAVNEKLKELGVEI